MTHETKDMTPAELRKFGLVTGAIIIGFIGFFLPWLKGGVEKALHWLTIAGPIGGILIIWAFTHPASLIHFYKPWMAFAEKLGWLNTRIILSIVFYLLFFPIGIIMKLTGKDPMHRKIDTTLSSYRITRETPSRDHMEKPY
ncbi:MAG TPA: SxtJ family membrane protein [Pseudomonadales bacterium]|nr:SxtJ family membrane protein [Pseudomonadales bacterium]